MGEAQLMIVTGAAALCPSTMIAFHPGNLWQRLLQKSSQESNPNLVLVQVDSSSIVSKLLRYVACKFIATDSDSMDNHRSIESSNHVTVYCNPNMSDSPNFISFFYSVHNLIVIKDSANQP